MTFKRKEMKTKYLVLSLTAIALLGVTSCESNLDIAQHGVVSSDDFYKTDTDAEQALANIYNQIQSQCNNSDAHWYMLNNMGDDVYASGDQRGDNLRGQQMNELTYDYTNEGISNFFSAMYTMIYKCNLVINNIDPSESSIKARAVAEAKVIRAWDYLYLVVLWGNPPLVLEAQRSDYKTPNSTSAEIYAQIEQDLTEAINSGCLMQKSSKDDRSVHNVTKQFAQALLGKTYMFEEKYSEAETVLDAVVNSGLYGLIDDFGGWSESSYNWNEEVMFGDNVVEDANNKKGFIPWLCTGWRTSDLDGVANLNMHYISWGQLTPRKELIEAFIANDGTESVRFKTTFKSWKDALDAGVDLSTSGKARGYYACPGYLNWKLRCDENSWIENSFTGCLTNDVIMKYNEVLLLAAEAKVRLGKSADALVNQIRVRAGLPELSGVTLEQIKTEKRLDCYLDGVRYMDLIRWKEADTYLADQGKYVPTLYYDSPGDSSDDHISTDTVVGEKDGGIYYVRYNATGEANAGFKERNWLLPYPQTEMNVNPNIVQNPGW